MASPPSFEDDAPYDEDDLINDYMDQDDVGPPTDQYDDAFVEEMMEERYWEKQQQTAVNPVHVTLNNGDAVKNAETGTNHIEKERDGDIVMKDTAHAHVPIEVTVDMGDTNIGSIQSIPILNKDSDRQLYSFERYV